MGKKSLSDCTSVFRPLCYWIFGSTNEKFYIIPHTVLEMGKKEMADKSKVSSQKFMEVDREQVLKANSLLQKLSLFIIIDFLLPYLLMLMLCCLMHSQFHWQLKKYVQVNTP